jgi:hypothetical protein
MLQPKVKSNMGIRSNLPMRVDNFSLLQLAKEIVDFKKEAQEEIKKAIERADKTAEETTESLAEIKKMSQKMDTNLEEMTNELVDILKEIQSQGLKGDKGEDANEEAIAEKVRDKFPTVESIIEEINPEKLAEKASSMIKPSPASLKIISQNLDGNEIVPKLNQASNLDELKLSIRNIKDWDKKWTDIKSEISRNKQGYHGGGFNNIASSGTVVSTGLDTLNFTGATVTQSGRTVTVAVSAGGLNVLAATGTIDDSNVTFTFTSVPVLVVINGSSYASTSTIGGTLAWTNVGTTVTLANPVGAGGSIYALG